MGPFPENMIRDAMLICAGAGLVVGLIIGGIVWVVTR